jgi:hypothetical protein
VRRAAAIAAVSLAAVAAACNPSPPRGGERGPCFGNRTCDPGLVCLSDLCVRPEPEVMGPTASAPAPGGRTPAGLSPAGLPTPCRDYLDLLDAYATCKAFEPSLRADLATAFARMRASWANLGGITWPQASIDACADGVRAIRTARVQLGC